VDYGTSTSSKDKRGTAIGQKSVKYRTQSRRRSQVIKHFFNTCRSVAVLCLLVKKTATRGHNVKYLLGGRGQPALPGLAGQNCAGEEVKTEKHCTLFC
jgi:hypothetical protein